LLLWKTMATYWVILEHIFGEQIRSHCLRRGFVFAKRRASCRQIKRT
jgi:hypothetical protein